DVAGGIERPQVRLGNRGADVVLADEVIADGECDLLLAGLDGHVTRLGGRELERTGRRDATTGKSGKPPEMPPCGKAGLFVTLSRNWGSAVGRGVLTVHVFFAPGKACLTLSRRIEGIAREGKSKESPAACGVPAFQRQRSPLCVAVSYRWSPCLA